MKRFILYVIFAFIFNFISCQQKNDLSKNLHEYYSLGFPNINHDWSEKDLEKAINSIEKLKIKNEFSLPKLDSKKSSEYFTKIITELPKIDILDSINLNLQFKKFGKTEKFYRRLSFAYGTQEKFQSYYSNELIEFDKYVLIETTKICKLYELLLNKMSEQMKILNKKNQEKFEGGLFKVYNASIDTSNPLIKFHLKDKIELTNIISQNITQVWHFFSENSKDILSKKMIIISKQNKSKKIRDIYLEILEKLK